MEQETRPLNQRSSQSQTNVMNDNDIIFGLRVKDIPMETLEEHQIRTKKLAKAKETRKAKRLTEYHENLRAQVNKFKS